METIEKKLKQFETDCLKAFVPMIFSFVGLFALDAVLVTLAAYSGAVLDDVHFVPIFLPQFFTFVVTGVHGAFKCFKINSAKSKFMEEYDKEFLAKEIDDIGKEIECLKERKENLERNLQERPSV